MSRTSRMIRPVPVSLVAVALFAVCAGCRGDAAAEPAETPAIEIKDQTGRTVQLDAVPQRIATTASFVVELLIELDHPPILRPNLPLEELSTAAHTIDTWTVDHSVGPNLEQLVAANPDLVITTPMFARYVPVIEARLRVPVIVLAVQELGDLARMVTLLSRVVAAEARGQTLIRELEARIDRIAPPPDRAAPRSYAIFGTPDSAFAFLPESYLGSLLAHLNAELITAAAAPTALSRQFAPLSLEFVVERDPELILIIRHGEANQELAELTAHPAWAQLSAVQNERVHVLSHRRYVTSPGLSAIDALLELRGLLYPERAEE